MALRALGILYTKSVLLLCVVAVFFCVVTSAYAAANEKIHYQGKLYNASSNPVTDGTYSIQFKLYTVSSGGSNIWTETQSVTTTGGVFSVLLGSVTSLTGINWNQPLYLGITVESDSEMTPRHTIGAVPAAHTLVDTLGVAQGGTGTSTVATSGAVIFAGAGGVHTSNANQLFINATTGNIGIGTTTPGSTLTVAGNVTATSFFGDGSNLTGLASSFSTSTTRSVFSSASTPLSYSTTTGVFTFSTSSLGLTTSDVIEGSGLYYTQQRFAASLAGTTTDALTQGTTNLYFSNSLARSALSSSATGLSYASSTGIFSLTTGYSIPLIASTTEWDAKISGGNGINGYLTRWTSASSIGTGTLLDNGTVAGVNATSSSFSFNVQGAAGVNAFNIASSTGMSLFMVSQAGNVGIGTTTPSAKLAITGTSGSTNDLFAIASSTEARFLTVTSAGNVGIGTTTPSVSLSVIGDTYLGGFLTIQRGAGSGAIKIGADVNATTLTPNVRKVGRIVAPSFDPALANTFLIASDNDGTNNRIDFGGYPAGSIYAATYIAFHTAAGTTTTGGTERMTITGGGNVGIGTTTPSQLLSVAGGFQLTGGFFDGANASGTIGQVLQTTGTSTRWVATSSLGLGLSGGINGYLTRWTSASSIGTGTLLDNGTVAGINATSSSFSFNVQGASGINAFNIASSTGTSLFMVSQAGNVGVGTSTPSAKFSITGTSGSATDLFVIASSTEAQYLTVTSAGNIGIGTTTPATKLHIIGSADQSVAGSAQIRFGEDPAYSGNLGYDNAGGSTLFLDNSYTASTAALSFRLGNTAKMTILGSGNVGIGTTSPSARVDIYGTSTAATTDLFAVSSSSNSRLLTVSAAGNVGVGTSSPSAKLAITGTSGSATDLFAIASSTEARFLTVTSAGNIGIGTSTPGVKLDIRAVAYSSNQANGILFGNTSNSLWDSSIFLRSDSGGIPRLSISGPNQTESLIIDSSGRVGISTTSPAAKFSVVGSTTSTNDVFVVASSTYAQFLTVKSTGNIGIGTTTPGEALAVVGNISATGTISAASSTFTNFTTGSIPFFGSGGVLSQNNTNLFWDNTNTRLGIGTTTPAQSLSVVGGFRLTGGFFDGANASGTIGQILQTTGTSTQWVATSTLGLGLAGGINGYLTRWTSASSIGTGTLLDNGTVAGINATSSSFSFNVQGASGINAFNIASSTGTSLFMVSQAGNVGVGTSTPGSLLTVAGSSTITGLGTFGAGISVNAQTFTNLLGSGLTSVANALTVATTTVQNFFSAGTGISYTGGTFTNTGVTSLTGTTNQVSVSNSTGTVTLSLPQNIHTGATPTFASTTLSNFTAGSIPFFATGGVLAQNNTNLFWDNVNARLGIGTTTPAQALSIVGGLRLTGGFFDGANASGTLGMVLQSTGTSTQWVATSSLGISGGSSLSGGVNGFLTRWTSATTVGTSTLLDNGTVAGVNATSSSFSFNVQGAAGVNAFNIASSTGTSLFMVSQAGNVGIGSTTTSPSAKLEVTGDIVSSGLSWTSRTSAADNSWQSVTYGNGLFVAVDISVTTGIMTSPDGINWTSRTAPALQSWKAVTYGNGLFVAVANNLVSDNVMTSPDGVNWTSRIGTTTNAWQSVTYGNGLFVAVSSTGIGNRVMTSPDGITWTSRTSAADSTWNSVTYGNGLFTAVGNSGAVMTSPDGITWTSRTASGAITWKSVTYGNGLFVAVSTNTATTSAVMTSPDGITWTSRTATATNIWNSVTYGGGIFVAVSSTPGVGNRVMTSSDGITWTSRSSAADNSWNSVIYGNGMFVAVAASGTGNRVMTSGKTNFSALATNNIYQGGMNIFGDIGIGTSTPAVALHIGSAATTSNVRIANGYLCVDNNDTCTGATTAGTVYAVGAYTTGADIAERYPTHDATLAPGEIVAVQGFEPAYVVRATSTKTAFGIISTAPGVLLAGFEKSPQHASTTVAVALAGRVPVKVSLENGPIVAGDRITLSSTPGVAMKATATSTLTLGIALEDYTGGSDDTVLTFVNLQDHIELPASDIIRTLGLSIDSLASSSAPIRDENGDKTFIGRFFDRLIAWFADTANGIGDLFAGKVHTDEICLKKTDGSERCVNGDDLQAFVDGGAGTNTASSTATTTVIALRFTPEVLEISEANATASALMSGVYAMTMGTSTTIANLEADIDHVFKTDPGTYMITYRATATDGAQATRERMVKVIAAENLSPETPTGGEEGGTIGGDAVVPTPSTEGGTDGGTSPDPIQ